MPDAGPTHGNGDINCERLRSEAFVDVLLKGAQPVSAFRLMGIKNSGGERSADPGSRNCLLCVRQPIKSAGPACDAATSFIGVEEGTGSSQ